TAFVRERGHASGIHLEFAPDHDPLGFLEDGDGAGKREVTLSHVPRQHVSHLSSPQQGRGPFRFSHQQPPGGLMVSSVRQKSRDNVGVDDDH
nr:hypothetical protein [Gemmatimonadaceae bacterium]